MNSSKKNSGVDWAELDANILRLISMKLALIFDFINFRVVCKWWRSATTPSDLPLQFPLLLECHDGRSDTELDVFSLQSCKTYTLNVTQVHGKYLSGASHGYVLAYRSGKSPSPSLLNPFTGSQLHLLFTEFRFFRTSNPWSFHHRKVGDGLICIGGKVRPNGDIYDYVGYWNFENIKWTKVAVPFGSAMAHYKEMLYIFDGDSEITRVVDVNTEEILPSIQSPDDLQFSHLIVTPRGLMGVDCLYPFIGGRKYMESYRYVVYLLEDEDEKPHWVKMNDIGNLILFIGSNNGICVSASDFDGFIGNCVYFLSSNNKTGYERQTYVGRYVLGKYRAEVVASAYTRSDCDWIVPSLC